MSKKLTARLDDLVPRTEAVSYNLAFAFLDMSKSMDVLLGRSPQQSKPRTRNYCTSTNEKYY